MAPLSKPEAVLKQAEKLVSVGQQHAALQSLTEMFSSKRFRSTPITSLEPIVHRFIELCVDMRKGRTAKEGLMQYKNIAQNSSVQSIEAVITRFVQLADAKVAAAQEKAAVQSAVEVDDLEASETPESILLGAVSGDQSKDRTDRALVTPWLKFLWESYRTSLETLKNNARLEAIYQQIAQQAFKFCLKHQRKVEFRRLCETLRLHLANVAKYAHQPHSINLSDPEVLQHHLDTRFAQLHTSVELELWQEAFRTVEDVHNLFTMAKKAPRPAMMADYYDKLTKIFLMSGNALFHAAAWNKYYSVATTVGVKTEEEMTRLCGQVLVSALAVPVGHAADEPEEVKGKNARLNALLGLSRMPTRSGLLSDALARGVLKRAPQFVQSLHKILEVTFDPLTLCKSVAPLLKELAADEGYASYLPLLQRALLSRLLSQLSQVYSTIKIANLLAIIAPLRNITADNTFDEEQIEAYIMGCARRGELNVRVDHKEGSITFIDDPFSTIDDSIPVAGPSSRGEGAVQTSTSELVRTRLSKVATCLHKSLQKIEPSPAELTVEDQDAKFKELAQAVEVERKALQVRRALIARRRELLSELSVKKEREESTRAAEKARKVKEEESKRIKEEIRLKEVERTKKEIESIRADEAKKYAQTLVEKGILKANDVEKMENYDTEALITIQVGQLEKEKKETSEKLRIISKRIDHIERAYRKEERPLLAEDYKKQQDQDRANFEAVQKAKIEAARASHQESLATKTRLSRMLGDFKAHREVIRSKKGDEYTRKKEASQKKINEEKAKRRQLVLKEREEARLAEEEAQAARRKAEEEARRKEEEQRAEQERLAREAEEAERKAAEAKAQQEKEAAARREERERERAEAAEAARRQREREEEAERRREERRALEKQQSSRLSAPVAVRGAFSSASKEPGDVWRRSTPSNAAPSRGAAATPPLRSESPAPATGAYRPPFASTNPNAPGGGWRARAEAAKAAATSGGPPPPVASRVASGTGLRPASPAPAREEPRPAAGDDDGFTTVAKKEVYRPRQRRV